MRSPLPYERPDHRLELHEKPLRESITQPCRPLCHYGTVTLCADGDHKVLAVMGIPGDLYWRIASYHSLSHEERSCASQASYERWTDRRKGICPKGHHVLCIYRIHRTSYCPSERLIIVSAGRWCLSPS